MKSVDYLVVVNLMSGKGGGKQNLGKVITELNASQSTYEVIKVESKNSLRVSELRLDNFKIGKEIICIGGDGTVAETVGLVIKNQLNLPIRIVPAGTGNLIATGIARVLGKNTGRKLLLLRQAQDRNDTSEVAPNTSGNITVDVFEAIYQNKRCYGVLGVGVGFSEEFISKTSDGFKNKIGFLSYILNSVRLLFSSKPDDYTISVDGEEHTTRANFVTILNLSPKYLKILPLFDDYKIDAADGLIDVFWNNQANKIPPVVDLLLFHVTGKNNFGHIYHKRAKEVLITADKPKLTQVDGELMPILPVLIKVVGKVEVRL